MEHGTRRLEDEGCCNNRYFDCNYQARNNHLCERGHEAQLFRHNSLFRTREDACDAVGLGDQ